MFNTLEEINSRPAPFEFYTADELWTNTHTAQQMFQYHLNADVDVSSRNHAFIEQSVNWITDYFKVGTGTMITDFGCAVGLYTNALAEKGAAVTGIDFSDNSLNYARQVAADKGLKVNYVHANYLEFETDETFDLIIMIMCDFCALSPEQRARLLSNFKTILNPGGAILLDVYSVNAFTQKAESVTYEKNQLNGFWSPDDYYAFVNSFKYETEKVTLDKYSIIEAGGTRTVYNWLQHFSSSTLKHEFTESGFIVEALFSDVAGRLFNPESNEIAIVARK
ncbi:MAG: class I SAM-dependent methyltransferase [Desulfobacterales bacterium]|nr:class I SAM-dependent methyltransferase [Desulfobacterales bacterium]